MGSVLCAWIWAWPGDILANGQILPSQRGLSSGTCRSGEAETTERVKRGRWKYRELMWERQLCISEAVSTPHAVLSPNSLLHFSKINIVKADGG